MIPDSKIEGFLTRLKNRTENGQTQWRQVQVDPEELEPEEELVGAVYRAELPPNYLRMAKVRYKYWLNEEDFTWDSRIVLDFVKGNGEPLWRFPARPAILEIYSLVQFSSSGVAEAIDAFMK